MDDTFVSYSDNTPSLIEKRIAYDVLEKMTDDEKMYPHIFTNEYINAYNSIMQIHNYNRDVGTKFPYRNETANHVIGMAIAARNDIALIGRRSGHYDPLLDDEDEEAPDRAKLPIGIYQYHGSNEGVYQICEDEKGIFGDLVAKYKPSATIRDKKEVFTTIRGLLPIRYQCNDSHMTIVGNGIFDMDSKTLLPFSEDFVFTSKIRTRLNPDALNYPPTVQFEDGTSLTVDEFMDDLSGGNKELYALFWELIQAVCLPLAPRNKMVLLYSDKGNNGKGTLCELIRSIIGHQNVANIPISEFGTNFGLENLGHAMAIITDENDTNTFSEKNATMKALITGDVITINPKMKSKYDFVWKGQVIQCLNALPKISDKTGSLKRRFLIVPMPSNFAKTERKYIKQRFIHMREVREYILARVLVGMNYRDTFSEPQCTKDIMREFEMQNENVFSFLEEILPQCKWDLLPAKDFLYAIYKLWLHDAFPHAITVSRNEFINEIKRYVDSHDTEFEWTDSTRSKGRIEDIKEPLIVQYNLREFLNIYAYQDAKYLPIHVKEKYSGLKRKPQYCVAQYDDNDD